MSTSESLSELYNILVKLEGPVLARETVTSVLHIAIAEIQSEGLSLSAHLLDEKLSIVTKKFVEASRKDVA